jgi:hypothetical protein
VQQYAWRLALVNFEMELLPGAYIPCCAKPCNNAPIIMTIEPHMIAHRRPTH